jgi:hypothetical protein
LSGTSQAECTSLRDHMRGNGRDTHGSRSMAADKF